MAGFGGWLNPENLSGRDPQVEAEERVAHAATALNEPRLSEAAAIFNGVLAVVDCPDEYLYTAEKFVKLFRREQILLNKGVDSLDFVRECVRRSFGVAQVVAFGATGPKMRWVTDEQIDQIARSLVAVGFVLPPNHGF